MPALATDPTAGTQNAPATELTNRTILRFYIPLALSWILMAVDGPVCTSAISRKDQPVLNTAGFLVLMSIALWVETPIIDLLTTSTTLSRSRANYLELRRFALALMTIVTSVHALVAFTPTYWVVTEGIIGVNHSVAVSARSGLILMLPWAPSIAWRRFLQGILIRFGYTRFVGFGTATRASGMTLAAVLLSWLTALPGIQIAALALIAGVFSEACTVHWASRRVIAEHFSSEAASSGEPSLGLRKLLTFHTPLVMTTLIMMCGTPIVAAALARLPNPVLTLAAFQVAASVQWLFRSFTYALPEVVITLYKDERSANVLKGFCLLTGTLATGVLVVGWLLHLDLVIFEKVLGANPAVSSSAHIAFLAGALLPFIGACQSYVRGMLTAHHLTVSRLMAVGLSMFVLLAALWLGVRFQANGLILAGTAYSLALTAELGLLAYAWRSGSRRVPAA